jgi:hypothetical protein
MTARASDGQFTGVLGAGDERSLAVKAETKIYKTALVGLDRASGYARGLVAGDQFQGIAYEHVDNTSGANGAKNAVVYKKGEFPFALSGAAKTMIGRPIFASDDATVTLAGAGNSYIGRITDVPEANVVLVEIDPMHRLTQTISVPLSSSAAAATKNYVGSFRTPIVVVNVGVSFETLPDVGALNVGTDDADPDEIVDAFDLTTLTAGDVSNMTLAGSAVAANTRIFATVGKATSTAGVCGGLTMEYFPMP